MRCQGRRFPKYICDADGDRCHLPYGGNCYKKDIIKLETEAFKLDVAIKIAKQIGDTFIDFKHMPPIEQWVRITNELYSHGYLIKEK